MNLLRPRRSLKSSHVAIGAGVAAAVAALVVAIRHRLNTETSADEPDLEHELALARFEGEGGPVGVFQ